jgi:negative regulator of sigma E activity
VTGAEFEGVDIDLLADYVGGALDGTPDEERVAALVATDTAWQAAYEALEPGMIAVGAVLREFEPEPMPDELAARLDALFRSPAAENEPAEPVPAKVVDLDSARRRRRRWAAPIAVAAAVVAFAGVGVNSFLTSESMSDTQSAAGSATNAEAEVMADTAGVDAVTTRSGTDYTSGTLAAAAGKQTRSSASADSPAPAAGEEPMAVFSLDRLSSPAALAQCLDEISRENGGVLSFELVDYARFKGSPAVIVRFSAPNGTWVWAVGPECGTSGAGANVLEQVPVR